MTDVFTREHPCPECHSWAPHLRVESETKKCRKCFQPQTFTYHVRRNTNGKETRSMVEKSRKDMMLHLAKCQPELLAQAGVTIEER